MDKDRTQINMNIDRLQDYRELINIFNELKVELTVAVTELKSTNEKVDRLDKKINNGLNDSVTKLFERWRFTVLAFSICAGWLLLLTRQTCGSIFGCFQ